MSDEGAISAFEKLLGRQSKPAEREQLYRVKEALGLRDNDALWLVLFALQYYDSLYRQFPKAIGQEAAKILGETRAAADASMRASLEQAKADLIHAMAVAAQGVAREAARRQMIQWLVAGMALGAALLATGFAAGRML
jgi:hypothetical protein